MSMANPKDFEIARLWRPEKVNCKPMFNNYVENTFKDMKRTVKPKTTLLTLQKNGILERTEPKSTNTRQHTEFWKDFKEPPTKSITHDRKEI